MQINHTIRYPCRHPFRFYTGMLMLMLAILVNSCNKETTSPTNYQYLIDFQEENLFTLQSIQTMFVPLEPIYPQAKGIKEHAGYSVQVFSMNYKTMYKGEEITASGLVCVPLAEEEFPVISFQVGTNTYHGYAPTASPSNLNYLLLEAMASNGYIILIPDYIGFGASSGHVHPYYQKESTNSTVIDMIQACREMVLDKKILGKTSEKTYLMGYSQGGWASLSVLEEIEQGDHPDITISAASCGAGAYDLMAMCNYVLALDTFPDPVYLPYFIYSQQVYGTLADPLDKYFNEPYASRIPGLFDGSHTNSEVNSNLNDTIARLITTDLLQNFNTGTEFQNLRNALTENSISPWAVSGRIRFYHGTEDSSVPSDQSQMIHNKFIESGATAERITMIYMEGMNHSSGIIPWGINTINWFNELEGK